MFLFCFSLTIIYCIPELASPGSRVRKTLELWYEDVSLIIDCVRVAPLQASLIQMFFIIGVMINSWIFVCLIIL